MKSYIDYLARIGITLSVVSGCYLAYAGPIPIPRGNSSLERSLVSTSRPSFQEGMVKEEYLQEEKTLKKFEFNIDWNDPNLRVNEEQRRILLKPYSEEVLVPKLE